MTIIKKVILTQYEAIKSARAILQQAGYNVNDAVYKALLKEKQLLTDNDKQNIEGYH